MKTFALFLLLLGLGPCWLVGCRQEPLKEGTAETKPAATTPGKKASETAAAAAKTEKKADEGATKTKADKGPAKVDDRPEVERRIANLKDNDWFVRREAAEALGKLGDKRAVESLIACLKDGENSVRFSAVYSLGELGDKRAVEPLIACLKENEADRAYAAEALGKLGDKRAVEPLIAGLKDDTVDRSCAVEALGKLADKQAVEPLIACLNDKDERVLRKAAEALGRFGDKRAVEPLIAALPNWPVKDAIGTALKQLDSKPAADKERFYCRVAQRDSNALLEDWKQTRQLILEDAGSQDPRKVQNAVYTVIALGKEEMVDDLVKLLNSCEDKGIAEIYLNCRHKGLSKAAEEWATRRGYNVPGGAGGSGPEWGRW